jgi:hypothetical protein
VSDECPDTVFKQIRGKSGTVIRDVKTQTVIGQDRLDGNPAFPLSERLHGIQDEIQQGLAEQPLRQMAHDIVRNMLFEPDL